MRKQITNFWNIFAKATPEALNFYRNAIFVVVAVDLFGVFYYLRMKSLAMAILIVCIAFLSLVLIAERRQDDEILNRIMTEDKKEEKKSGKKAKKKVPKKKKKVEDEEDEEPQSVVGMDFGMPDPDEYNKRLEKAVGM